MLDNIEYSKDWLLMEILKLTYEEKQTGKSDVVVIKKSELLLLVKKFVDLNEREVKKNE